MAYVIVGGLICLFSFIAGCAFSAPDKPVEVSIDWSKLSEDVKARQRVKAYKEESEVQNNDH